MSVVCIAGYQFVELTDLNTLKEELNTLCNDLGLKGTILLSSEGVNQFLAGPAQAIGEYQQALQKYPFFRDLTFIKTHAEQSLFNKLLVKIKPEIITTGDLTIKPQDFPAKRISAQIFKQWLDEGRDISVLDTRNTFEFEMGSFDKASHLNIQCFSQFAESIKLVDKNLLTKPMVIFCTGGVRCEKAAPMLAQEGFSEVYQLDGGILRYFEQCGNAHFKGECFVFDKRIAVDSELKPVEMSVSQEI